MNKEIKQGTCIAYRTENTFMLYFFIQKDWDGSLVFCRMFVLPNEMKPSDFWRMSPKYFNDNVENGNITIYEDGFPNEVVMEWEEFQNRNTID
jgi:hypothetical protein